MTEQGEMAQPVNSLSWELSLSRIPRTDMKILAVVAWVCNSHSEDVKTGGPWWLGFSGAGEL